MAGAQQTVKAMQGKEDNPKGNGKAFIEERKENRANLGAQVINGGFGQNQNAAQKRQASATKRRPAGGGLGPSPPAYGRNTQGGWAKG